MVNCNKKLTLEEQELELLRKAVDKAEMKIGKKIKASNDIENIIKILEDFLRRKKVVCYGGTAINNILPATDQFYNNDIEIPDYDFYSPNAIQDAKYLANLYANNSYNDVDVRSGMHEGTYKVFVNFIPIADITQLNPKVFKVLLKNSIRKNGISYAPPEFLRLQTYNELSRPDGDVSRWEKIYKRLMLLNKHYPIKINPKCLELNFMREYTGNPDSKETLFNVVKDAMINEGVVFIGGYASSLYGNYMPANQKKQLQHVPDFDVLAEDPRTVAYRVKDRLREAGFKNVKINKKPSVENEIILAHYEIVVDNDTVCFIYEPNACYSFNTIHLANKPVKVATIETMLLFLISFLYADRPYYDQERIHCMVQYLINVLANNRLKQTGLLKRFNLNCYGTDHGVIEMRSKKAEKYEELKVNPNPKEFDKYFFKYVPIKDFKKQKHTRRQSNNNIPKRNIGKTRKNNKKNSGIKKMLYNIF